MNQIEIQIFQSQPLHGLFKRGQSGFISLIGIPQLARYKDFFPGKAGIPDGTAHALFISISGRRIDMPVAPRDRFPDRGIGHAAILRLPGAKPNAWYFYPVRQLINALQIFHFNHIYHSSFPIILFLYRDMGGRTELSVLWLRLPPWLAPYRFFVICSRFFR